jgi:hypothetical protein
VASRRADRFPLVLPSHAPLISSSTRHTSSFDTSGGRRSNLGSGVIIAAFYIAVAVVAYWHVWTASTPSVVEPRGLDSQLNMWFLTWVPFALLHGHNPFFTVFGNYPYGVNLLASTGVTLLGLIASPVTLLFGPVVAYNLLLTLAMASSATAAYVLARRFTRWRPAAFCAGLLYGFSPYMVGQGIYHLHLVFVPIPPLIFLALHQILVVQDRRPVTWGAILGVLVCAQYFISTEILADTFVVGAISLVVLVVLYPRQVIERARHAATALSVATALGVVVLVPPSIYALIGPAHITGPINAIPSQANRGDLLGAIVPNQDQHFAPASLIKIGNHFADNPPEDGSYLGVPLVLVMMLSAMWFRRVKVVIFCAVMVLATYVLSLGSRLIVSGSPSKTLDSGLRLPEGIFDHIPLLSSGEPARYSLFVALFSSVLLAVTLDRIRHERRIISSVARTGIPILIGIGVLIPLVPTWPYPASSVAAPSYFTSASSAGVDSIPAGSPALLYPFPSAGIDDALPMLWQAMSFMRFKSPGGYFLVPQLGTGRASLGRTTLTSSILSELYRGVEVARTEVLRAQLRSQLDAWKIQSLVAAPLGTDPGAAISFLTWLAGGPPMKSHGVEVWYHLEWRS